MKCKSAAGRFTEHKPINQPHNSIPNITRTVCERCGKVLDWISLEARAARGRKPRIKVSRRGGGTTRYRSK